MSSTSKPRQFSFQAMRVIQWLVILTNAVLILYLFWRIYKLRTMDLIPRGGIYDEAVRWYSLFFVLYLIGFFYIGAAIRFRFLAYPLSSSPWRVLVTLFVGLFVTFLSNDIALWLFQVYCTIQSWVPIQKAYCGIIP